MNKGTKGNKKIVIFEDKPKNLSEFRDELKSLLSGKAVDIVDFNELYEDKKPQFKEEYKIHKQLEQILDDDKNNLISMVIVDLDLSQYQEYDISEPIISNICDKLGIPICLYSQLTDEYEMERFRNWSERHIVLDMNENIGYIARQCADIFDGFQAIKEKITEVNMQKISSPLEVISKIMKAPEGAEAQIVHYTTGYFSLMGDRLKYNDHRIRFFPVLLGYWLYNSLLRFPGVILNETAAASYLNIDVEFFKRNEDVRGVFGKAKYKGPFNKIAPYWWKDTLDELISEFEGDDEEGVAVRNLLKQKGININVPPVRCVEGDHEGAGFYCILTKKPVCAKHSTGNIAWLPAGAIYSRISNSKWEELGPWFGF